VAALSIILAIENPGRFFLSMPLSKVGWDPELYWLVSWVVPSRAALAVRAAYWSCFNVGKAGNMARNVARGRRA
jgi:hypothetical protein